MPHLPKTLFDLSGAPARPAPLAQSALVLIDAQNEYVDGALPLAGVEAAIAAAAEVLALARAHGLPVIHIVHHTVAGAPVFDPTSPLAQIVPALAPQAGEVVIVKRLPNSFAGTPLHETLSQTGRQGLILVGFMTHMCVSTTARAALELGYQTTVVAAATATRDLPDPLAGSLAEPLAAVVPAAALQRAALTALGDRFAAIVADAAALAAAVG